MYTVIVNLQVRPELREDFLAGIRANALASVRDEPGCLRFDVHEKTDDPNKFILYELYSDEAAFYDAHRSTPHYERWREVAARCVYPGGHVNTFATPAFPSDVAESAQLDEQPQGRQAH